MSVTRLSSPGSQSGAHRIADLGLLHVRDKAVEKLLGLGADLGVIEDGLMVCIWPLHLTAISSSQGSKNVKGLDGSK